MNCELKKGGKYMEQYGKVIEVKDHSARVEFIRHSA